MRSRRILALGVIAFSLAMSAFTAPAHESAAPGGAWLLDVGASVGDLTAGGFVAGRYRLPLGLTLGLELDATSETSVDPVVGLSGGYPFYLSAYASGGWDFRLGSSCSLGVGLLLGGEASFLTERVVDPAHGIDQSYSTADFMFDPACRIDAAWYPWEAVGFSISALVSFYDLRKSLASVCLSLRSPPAAEAR